MKDLAGKVAFITGGASGIGLAMAKAFGKAGVTVALADIDEAAARNAVEGLTRAGVKSLALQLDVADPQAWARAADHAESALGPVRILCNNAGVGGGLGSMDTVPYDVWRWVFSVNVDGHFHAMRTFLPRLKARGTEAHLVHTVSMAGFLPTPNSAAYGASKFAAMGLAQILRAELKDTKIGMSVVCPGMVRTNLPVSAQRARPAGVTATAEADVKTLAGMMAQGMDPDCIGARVVKAVENNEFYVLTHADWKPMTELHFAEILNAFGESAEPGYTDAHGLSLASH